MYSFIGVENVPCCLALFIQSEFVVVVVFFYSQLECSMINEHKYCNRIHGFHNFANACQTE